MKFPDSWTGELGAGACHQTGRRDWKASLAKWALAGLFITGGLIYAAKTLPNCMALAPGSAAPAILTAADEPDANWFWLGYDKDICGGIPFHAAGCAPEDCQNFGLGVDIKHVTWFSSQGSGHFPGDVFTLETYVKRDCTPSLEDDRNFTRGSVCVPAKVFSWKVVPIIKDEVY